MNKSEFDLIVERVILWLTVFDEGNRISRIKMHAIVSTMNDAY